jgi:DNA-directed RNA polymerase specialized sigma subunit
MGIQKLVEEYYSGNQDRVNDIYSYFSKKIEWQKSYHNLDFAEKQSDLNIALTKALNTYDISKNYQFSTYFWTIFHNEVNTKKVRKKSKKRTGEVCSINSSVGDEEQKELADFIADEVRSKDVQKVTNKIAFFDFLKNNNIKGIDKTILIGLYTNKSQTEIAEDVKKTTACISNRVTNMKSKKWANDLFQLLKES